jgi:hypothetical protein
MQQFARRARVVGGLILEMDSVMRTTLIALTFAIVTMLVVALVSRGLRSSSRVH